MKISKNAENFTLFKRKEEIPRGCIAFFDSGIGGLSVLYECVLRGLSGPVAYFGDNKNAPYGERSIEEILLLFNSAFEFLASYSPRCVVVACNTVSAVLENRQVEYSIPIIKTYPPVEQVEEEGEVYLFATTQTIKLTRERVRARARAYPLSNLASQIEQNPFSLSKISLAEILPKGNPSAVVLGCTHYSFLKEGFMRYYGVPVYDSSVYTAMRVMEHCRLFSTTDIEESERAEARLGENEKKGELFPCLRIKRGIQETTIFFVGSGKNTCLWLCEQMFAHKYG